MVLCWIFLTVCSLFGLQRPNGLNNSSCDYCIWATIPLCIQALKWSHQFPWKMNLQKENTRPSWDVKPWQLLSASDCSFSGIDYFCARQTDVCMKGVTQVMKWWHMFERRSVVKHMLNLSWLQSRCLKKQCTASEGQFGRLYEPDCSVTCDASSTLNSSRVEAY